MKRSVQCITCVALQEKPIRKAKHFVKRNDTELGFCDIHHDEYLAQEEFSINLKDAFYECGDSED